MKPRIASARYPARSHRPVRVGGWSLIEMLVVVAVMAALTLAAVPTYRSAMLRAHRVEATAGLAGLAAAQERFRLQHSTYADDLQASPPDGLGLSAMSAGGRYALAITSADAFAFTATATARGRQSQDTHCAEFSIDATGARTATHDDCWSR
jgi:type IV pilus assembly protein PilE